MDVERVGSCSPADLPPPHQVRYTSRQTFLQFRSTRHGIDVEFYRVLQMDKDMLHILLTPMILISRMCPSELVLMHHRSPHLYRGPW